MNCCPCKDQGLDDRSSGSKICNNCNLVSSRCITTYKQYASTSSLLLRRYRAIYIFTIYELQMNRAPINRYPYGNRQERPHGSKSLASETRERSGGYCNMSESMILARNLSAMAAKAFHSWFRLPRSDKDGNMNTPYLAPEPVVSLAVRHAQFSPTGTYRRLCL